MREYNLFFVELTIYKLVYYKELKKCYLIFFFIGFLCGWLFSSFTFLNYNKNFLKQKTLLFNLLSHTVRKELFSHNLIKTSLKRNYCCLKLETVRFWKGKKKKQKRFTIKVTCQLPSLEQLAFFAVSFSTCFFNFYLRLLL